MRWGYRVLAGVALAAAFVLAGVPAAAQGSERIRGYDVELQVEASGALRVTENIDYDFGSARRHGIVREVPVRSRYDESRDRLNRVTVLSVGATPGTPATFETENNGPVLDLRIGDPDRTISGRHRYTIAYQVEGALNGFADHDELYWNAVGADWSVPIDRVSVHVLAPTVISRVNGYRGPLGSRQPVAGQRIDGASGWFRDTGLAPGEAFTVVVAFPAGVIPPPTPILRDRWSLARAFSITPFTVGLFASLSLLALVAGWLVFRSGRDRRPGGSIGIDGATAAFVEYRPPDGLPPGLAGLLVNLRVRPIDVIATIVDLAVRRYLDIEDVGGDGRDWRLVRRKDADDGLLGYERLLFDALFSPTGRHGSEILMSSLRDRFAGHYKAVREAFYREGTSREWFVARPDRVRVRGFVTGALVSAVGIGLTVLAAWSTHFALVPVPIAVVGLALLIGAWWLPRRTATGRALYERVASFRSYLRDTTFTFRGDDRRSDSLDQYLAYAMVFGLTGQWRDAVRSSRPAVHTGPYVGTFLFLPTRFADHADDFSRSWSDTLTSTPSSSSSGFGGFSGGGGGGGGGGSW